MSGKTLRLQVTECLKAIREGRDDSELMDRFGLSQKQLADVFERLVKGGHLFPAEVAARAVFLSQRENRTTPVEPDGGRGSDYTRPEPSKWPTPAGGAEGAVRNKPISPKDIRVDGEMASLCVTLASMTFVLLLLVRSSFGTVMIFLIMIAAMIKVKQGQLLGNSVRTSQHQLSELHEIATDAAQCLDMDFQDVFVIQDPVINAYAVGFLGKKSVVLHSATVEAMTPEELKFIVGHELTHIKCHHTIWTALANAKGAVRVPIVADLLSFIMLHWSRKAEYTADRGGLIASHDLVSAVSALAKLTVGKELFQKMNLDHLLHQLHELDQNGLTKLTELFASHPYTVRRIQALKAFYETAEYQGLIFKAKRPILTKKSMTPKQETKIVAQGSPEDVGKWTRALGNFGRSVLAVLGGIGLAIMWTFIAALSAHHGNELGLFAWLGLTVVGLVCYLIQLKRNRRARDAGT